jgi:hypothetical protein
LKRNKKILAKKREGKSTLGTGVSQFSPFALAGRFFGCPLTSKKEEFIITKVFFGIVEI